MKTSELNNERILTIIKNAKKIYSDACVIHNHTYGMCWAIQNAIFEVSRIATSYAMIVNLIPEFNSDELAGKKYSIPTLIHKFGGNYWWPPLDTESRLKAFDKLIEIYANKSSISITRDA